MLYWLLYQKLFAYFPPFRIFRYVTFRTAFASLTALFMGLIIGPAIIRQLREFQIGQYIREEGPKAHQKKAGTPTMGGVLITIAIIVPTLLWAIFPTLIYGWRALHDCFRRDWLCRRLFEDRQQTEPWADGTHQASAAVPGGMRGGNRCWSFLRQNGSTPPT